MSQTERHSKFPSVDAANSDQAHTDTSTFDETSASETATEGGPTAGEGSYEGTRDYAASIDSYMRNADIDDAIQAAAPTSASEEGELLRAEAEGASRTKAPGE